MDSDTADTGIVLSYLGADLKPVYAGQTGNPTTHGDVYFSMWFNDAYSYNVSAPGSIAFLYDSAAGSYTFDGPGFFPLDNQLLGNDGLSHNYNFTMEMHAAFTYKAGQTFSCAGGDDVWVYIDNRLVIDLGGDAERAVSVDLDRLGLTEGGRYGLDLFFAKRRTSESGFTATTNIPLEPRESYQLRGYKYNGATGEPINGWPIYLEYLKGSEWISFKSTLTGTDGLYVFSDLPAGDYRIKEYAEAPWSQVYPGGDGMHYVTLPEESPGRYDFRNVKITAYSIRGTKYDAERKPLAGFTIILEKQSGTDTWTEVARTITDANGGYCFGGLSDGVYRVSEEKRTGWTQLYPAGDGKHIVTLPEGASGKDDCAPDYDFMNTRNSCGFHEETAWAYGNHENNDYTNSSNWGWSNGPIKPGIYDYPLYAGAGQNDPNKGMLVGHVHVEYAGAHVTVTYKPFVGIEIIETHLWIGDKPLPYKIDKKGAVKYQSAPGKMNAPVGKAFDVSAFADVYVAAHAVVRIPND